MRLVWTIYPHHRSPPGARVVAPWSAVIEARHPGALELAGHDRQFYTGPVALVPSRGWVFRTLPAALRAHRRRLCGTYARARVACIAGGSGHGKSALMRQIAEHIPGTRTITHRP